jgi:hypothetical protein
MSLANINWTNCKNNLVNHRRQRAVNSVHNPIKYSHAQLRVYAVRFNVVQAQPDYIPGEIDHYRYGDQSYSPSLEKISCT